ncbi:hypothetical protein HAX54_002276 [Datura stramonium]|uniref:Uncharacterized protein n=1 Tax=Datura stramonium TaxID=4076 RepID=A0ABS8T5W6_DATST|nr:hypothetical protein [Datura stramonium]
MLEILGNKNQCFLENGILLRLHLELAVAVGRRLTLGRWNPFGLGGTSSASASPGLLRTLEAILLGGNYFVTVEWFLEVGGDVFLPSSL